MDNKKYALLILSFFLTTGILFSQTGIEWAKRAEKQFPDDKVVLTNSEVIYEFRHEYQKRKEGRILAYEERSEEFVNTGKDEKITYAMFYDEYSTLPSFTTSPITRVIDTYYQQDDIFHSDVRAKYANLTLKHFGSQVTVDAEKKYKDLKYLTKVYFPSLYSCLSRKIEFIIPSQVEIEFVEKNFEGHNITKQESDRDGNKIYTYYYRNVKKYADNPGLPGSSYIYPHIVILVKGVENQDEKTSYFNSTQDLYNWYHKLVNKVNNKRDSLEGLVAKLTADCETETEKVERLFYWVQDNIRYIAFEDGIAGFKPEECQKVYFKRYGDCKGMANLTKEMLQIAGFDARLVWLGTRQIAYDYSLPSLSTDNHMICAVKMDGEFIFLDATEKFMPLGNYAERIQGQAVMIEDGENFILQEVPVKDLAQNLRKIAMDFELKEKNLEGNIEFEMNGEAKSEMLYYLNYTPGKKQEELLKVYLAGGEAQTRVSDIELEGIETADETLMLKGKASIPNHASSFDDETYLYIDPYQFLSSYEMDEEREFAYWFDSKRNDQLEIKFKVPVGMTSSSLPEALKIENEEFVFDCKYEQVENQITYTVNLQIPHAIISAENLESWNEAVKLLKEFYEQPIILKAKS